MGNNLVVNPAPNSMNFTPPKPGVVDVPKISQTPVTDTLNIKEIEKQAEKPIKLKKNKNIIFRTIDILQAGIALIAVGFLGKHLYQVLKKLK